MSSFKRSQAKYVKRSRTTFYRYKTIVGSVMRARWLSSQRVEATVGCRILNVMTALGMLDGVMIA